MQLYIKTQPTSKLSVDYHLEPSILPLEIEENDTIECIKAIILGKTGIPSQLQVIYFDAEILQNERTLHSYSITNECTLLLLFTAEIFPLRLRPAFVRKTIYIEAFEDDKIMDIKTLVLKEEHIPFQPTHLLLNGRELESDKKLSEYAIHSGTKLSLAMKLVTKEINVTGKQLYHTENNFFTFQYVSRKDAFRFTIAKTTAKENLKNLISSKTGIPKGQICFFYNGFDLDEIHTYCETEIILKCVRREPDLMRIVVNFSQPFKHSESRISLHPLVNRHNSLEEIDKVLVHKLSSVGYISDDYIPSIRSDFKATDYKGAPLTSETLTMLYPRQNKSLIDYEVTEGSELFYYANMRGGGIPVYIALGSTTTNYYVREDETVNGLKHKIEKKQGFPIARQQLAYEGGLLDDAMKINEYNIGGNSVIQLLLKPQKGAFEISAYLPTGRVLRADVSPDDTIARCKKRIAEEEKLDPDSFNLVYLKRRKLSESGTVYENSIRSGTLIHVVSKSGTIKINVHSVDHKILGTVYTNDDETVLSLKVRIHMEIPGVPLPGMQRILQGDTLLNESMLLKHCFIKDDGSLTVSTLKKLFIATPNGSTIKVKVYQDEKIWSVMKCIERETQIKFENQQLTYQDKILKNEQIIASCNFAVDPMLQLSKSVHKELQRIAYTCMYIDGHLQLYME